MRFRLDSSLADDHRWTTPLTRPRQVLIGRPHGAELRDADGSLLRTWDDPLAALSWLDDVRRRGGRWVGFLGYELGALLEPAVGGAVDIDVPLFTWGWVDADPTPLSGRATGSLPASAPVRPHDGGPDPTSNFTRDQYLHAVRRCLDYIAAGDVFQVNLSQRLQLDFAGEAAALYDALLARTPAAYGALLELDHVAILSNSPELFLRVTPDRRIMTQPIKGTRPNGPGLSHMAHELLASAKDAAELNMIVDLERNDLGRVCEIGSVRVSRRRHVEAHPTVFHGVAQVEGRLRPDVGLVDLLRATFPGGSVTGAPKIRAMQIIGELEPAPRGVYCGAIGHLDADGSLQLNLAIRTMTLDKRSGTLYIPVGGGIVAESDPAAEYEETWVKARAALEAASLIRPAVPRSAPSSLRSRGAGTR
jgi:anthranilate/para-aminobenzoate synthase component I